MDKNEFDKLGEHLDEIVDLLCSIDRQLKEARLPGAHPVKRKHLNDAIMERLNEFRRTRLEVADESAETVKKTRLLH